jgi:hypothetical protein
MRENMSEKKAKDHAADALKEAAERRAGKEKLAQEIAKEHGGRDGPEATRYGDWEKNGITSDF